MKVSELIRLLAEVLVVTGDLEVKVYDTEIEEDTPVESIEITPQEDTRYVCIV